MPFLHSLATLVYLLDWLRVAIHNVVLMIEELLLHTALVLKCASLIIRDRGMILILNRSDSA